MYLFMEVNRNEVLLEIHRRPQIIKNINIIIELII